MFCLNNQIIEFNGVYYTQTVGIVTGENNSVSVANVALHFIIRKIKEINNHTEIFVRFIDDIMLITKDDDNCDLIQNKLLQEFKNNGLDLTFRVISTKDENKTIEFLDVWHEIRKTETKKFITKNYTKPTAEHSTFINGKSFHPRHVYRGIILGESKRMMRINEKEEDYQRSLEKLREKCLKSEFNKKIVEDTINKTKKWKKGIENKKTININTREKKKIPWATKFKSLLKLNPTEKKISSNTQITFSRPPTIGSLLTNYRKISQEEKNKNECKTGASKKCGRCGLCGNFGKMENMVLETKKIKTKSGRKISLKQNLNCRHYGIYAAKCKQCGDLYVGQTINKFSQRWNGHRKIWKELLAKQNETEKRNKKIEIQKDEQSLYVHYSQKHHDKVKDLQLHQAYDVIFIESPSKEKLDLAESYWIGKLEAGINISRTCLPKIR